MGHDGVQEKLVLPLLKTLFAKMDRCRYLNVNRKVKAVFVTRDGWGVLEYDIYC